MKFGAKKAALPMGGAALPTQSATIIRTDLNFKVPAPYLEPGVRTAVTCLLNVQIRRYQRVTSVPRRGLERHARELYTKYSHAAIIRAILKAAESSEYPFSFKLVEKNCEWGQCDVQRLRCQTDQPAALFD